MLLQRIPASVDEELFFEYISNVFIPSVDAVGNRPGLETEAAILQNIIFLHQHALWRAHEVNGDWSWRV
jgi:hypothetical protein